MPNILIIDDDSAAREVLSKYLAHMGMAAKQAATISEGLKKVSSGQFDLVFLDVYLPDGNGLDALPAIVQSPSKPEVIIITGLGDPQGAALAVQNNAWDYIQKPITAAEIKLLLKRALDYRASKKRTNTPTIVTLKRPEIIGTSPQLTAQLDIAAQCANSDANVLITGETGTGKELFAKTIHQNSANANNRFVIVDCAALPEQIVESVLFGNVKGAYTGADQDRDGLIKQADGGTLLLDEIGELPLTTQKKFLRVLQERTFKPVGGTREITSNFRLISATNRDLEKLVRQNRFRKDLFFRLRTFCMALPPLRACKEDIKSLILFYIDKLCQHHGMENKGFIPEFLELLNNYDWPGNVRELINTLEKAILSDPLSPVLYPFNLPADIRVRHISSSMAEKRTHGLYPETSGAACDSNSISIPAHLFDPLPPLKALRDKVNHDLELRYIRKLMALNGFDLDKASHVSGLSIPRLYALLKKHNISRP